MIKPPQGSRFDSLSLDKPNKYNRNKKDARFTLEILIITTCRQLLNNNFLKFISSDRASLHKSHSFPRKKKPAFVNAQLNRSSRFLGFYRPIGYYKISCPIVDNVKKEMTEQKIKTQEAFKYILMSKFLFRPIK